MILTAAILVPLSILVIIIFFRLAPQAKRFNISVLVILLALCAGVTIWLKIDMSDTPDSAWWPVVAGFWCLSIVVVGLTVASLVRHFRARRGLMPNSTVMWPFKSDLRIREVIGLSLIVLSIALTPVAWATSRILWVVCGGLFLLGGILFYTQRIVDREMASAKEGGEAASYYTGPKMSGDVYNYSGWRTGGRSGTMDADSGGADGE